MAVLLTGKPVADALSADTRTRAEALLSKGVQPRLVLLRCGDNEADGAYIRGAVKRAALCGVAAELRTLPADASADVVAAAIDAVNRDPAVHGCLLLRPLPPHLRGEESDLCARLTPDKDVDGMTPESAAAVFTGQGRGLPPAPPRPAWRCCTTTALPPAAGTLWSSAVPQWWAVRCPCCSCGRTPPSPFAIQRHRIRRR